MPDIFVDYVLIDQVKQYQNVQVKAVIWIKNHCS